MAVTKIIAIRDRLDKRVDYASNGDKTILTQRVDYATNPEKTEDVQYVDVLNCRSKETASDEMMATKRRWNKTGGVLGYHFIQSFAPGEVTPEQAHEIGMEFARRLFGDRFEVVVGTHLDKAHPHNHIVVNSVSFVDGKKYHSSPESYYNTVRATSDALCKENALSTIAPKGKGKQYGEWRAEKDGKPTVRGMIRADMDAIIAEAYTLDTFFTLLERKGYTVRRRGEHRKYTTVRPPGGQKAIRLASLGEAYTEEGIKARLARQRLTGFPTAPVRKPKPKKKTRYRVRGLRTALRRKKITGFQALYLRYLYLLRRIKKSKRPYRSPFPLRQELAKLERYQKQFRYLTENGITTVSDLDNRVAALEAEIDTLAAQRKPLYEERKEAEDEEERTLYTEEIDRYTAALRQKRRELALCRRIQADVPVVTHARQAKEEPTTQQEQKEEQQHEHEWRSRRSGGTREY